MSANMRVNVASRPSRLAKQRSWVAFLRNASAHLYEQLHRVNDGLLQRFIHLPEHRSRLLSDLDSTVVFPLWPPRRC